MMDQKQEKSKAFERFLPENCTKSQVVIGSAKALREAHKIQSLDNVQRVYNEGPILGRILWWFWGLFQ